MGERRRSQPPFALKQTKSPDHSAAHLVLAAHRPLMPVMQSVRFIGRLGRRSLQQAFQFTMHARQFRAELQQDAIAFQELRVLSVTVTGQQLANVCSRYGKIVFGRRLVLGLYMIYVRNQGGERAQPRPRRVPDESIQQLQSRCRRMKGLFRLQHERVQLAKRLTQRLELLAR